MGVLSLGHPMILEGMLDTWEGIISHIFPYLYNKYKYIFLKNYIGISPIVYNICTVYNDVHIHIYIELCIFI